MSDEEEESLAALATVVGFDAPVLGCAGSNSLVGCEGRFSGLEYPAAARVCDVTPCKPVKPGRFFFVLLVMNRCK